MSILADIFALLRRPLAPVERPDPPPTKGKAKPIPPDDMPVTQEEITTALALCASERADAWTTIDTVSDRREELLLQDGTDRQIVELEQQVDSAKLLLERLDRVEPDLRHRLTVLQDAAKTARFAELRDAYVTAGRGYIAYMRSLDPTPEYIGPLVAYGMLVAEYPGVKGRVPVIAILPTPDVFEAKLREFSHVVHNPRPDPMPSPMVRDRLKDADAAGLDAVRSVWGDNATVAVRPRAWIRLLAGEPDGEGIWQKVGSVICVPGEEAELRVQAGTAVIAELQGDE